MNKKGTLEKESPILLEYLAADNTIFPNLEVSILDPIFFHKEQAWVQPKFAAKQLQLRAKCEE